MKNHAFRADAPSSHPKEVVTIVLAKARVTAASSASFRENLKNRNPMKNTHETLQFTRTRKPYIILYILIFKLDNKNTRPR